MLLDLQEKMMINKKELIAAIKVLRKEVEILTSRLEPHDTGHLHTAISVINSRIDEMMEQLAGG